MKTALWWVRRDLRLSDNQALTAALSQVEQVLPVFVLDPALLRSPYAGAKRLAFMFAGLRLLDAQLTQRGSGLLLRRGDPLEVLSTLSAEVGAQAIYAEADYSPYALRRDRRVSRLLPLHLTPGLTLHPPAAIVKADGTPYTVFTPFSKAWRARPTPGELLPAPEWIPTPFGIPGEAFPEVAQSSDPVLFPAGEAEAQRRLASFSTGAITRYSEERNRMDLAGTSSLSPYLRFGMLSARQAVSAAQQAVYLPGEAVSRRGAETWLNELIWREFYIAILYHFPQVRQAAFRPEMRSIRWVNDPAQFAAWADGRTGYPVVDAAMRQLSQTGWMHNRARMIVASFLTKDLLVDWRWGERHFMQHLLDGDPAANNGGWQWTAGTGTDAAPYFRVFNPTLQGMKFDPQGDYVRTFVPELRNVPDEFIHAPWELPLDSQKKFGCIIGENYPAPIVEHAWARQRVLQAYKA